MISMASLDEEEQMIGIRWYSFVYFLVSLVYIDDIITESGSHADDYLICVLDSAFLNILGNLNIFLALRFTLPRPAFSCPRENIYFICWLKQKA